MVSPASLFIVLGFAAGAMSQREILYIGEVWSLEYYQASSFAGLTSMDVRYTAEIEDWTTEEFSAYSAIVFGDAYCQGAGSIDILNTNRAAWSRAITGNIVLMGGYDWSPIRDAGL
jgi:hypothetical protein